MTRYGKSYSGPEGFEDSFENPAKKLQLGSFEKKRKQREGKQR